MRAALAVVALLAGCDRPAPHRPPKATRTAAMAHAGLSTPPDRSDGPRRAVDAALAVVEAGGDPLDAAVAGVVVMEDDPRFNAGTGSRVRIDGATVQMDASVMRSDGKFAAVAAIERVKNPVKVARAVLDTPHVMLAGDGATAFARTLGMPDYDPTTPEMKQKAEAVREQLRTGSPELPEAWRSFDWRARWNFATPFDPALRPGSGQAPAPDAGAPGASSDTVGCVVRTADGRFAAALSTGGTTITLRGRVGDVPIYGAGLFASEGGASAATGDGEYIVRAAVSRTIDEWLRAGVPADEAARRAVELVRAQGGGVGVIVLGTTTMSVAATAPMAWAARESGSTAWQGPDY